MPSSSGSTKASLIAIHFPETHPFQMQDIFSIIPFTQPALGTVNLPGSKSITNRALLLAALNEGPVTLQGALFSEDTDIMVTALRTLGFKVTTDEKSRRITVHGKGGMIPNAKADIQVGNAGTVARFLTAALALRWGGTFRLDGTEAMRKRPMRGLLEALEGFGCSFGWEGAPYHFPFSIRTQGLRTGIWKVNAETSSQILSALLMVASLAGGPVRIQQLGNTVSEPFVEMTNRMIAHFRADGDPPDQARDGYEFKAAPYQLATTIYEVEPDATAASYFMSLPLVTGGKVEIGRFSTNSLQGDLDFHKILEEVGLETSFESNTMYVEASSNKPSGGHFEFNAISDTFLTLAALAPLLPEPVKISGIAHTRKQETDRIAACATELRKLGQGVTEEEDSIAIVSNKEALIQVADQGVEIDTYEDHRIAMSFAILGCADLRGDGQPWLAIRNPSCCRKTFPEFFDELNNLRLSSET